MPDESDFNAVVADVQLLAQTDAAPALNVSEVEAIVRETARASTWVAETAYAYGAFVIPTAANLNGRRYRVIVAGTSDEEEPTWGTDDGGTFTDGTVSYEEAGPFSGSVYDKRKAIEKCLTVKEAKVMMFADVGSVSFSQMVGHIRALRSSYRPLDIA